MEREAVPRESTAREATACQQTQWLHDDLSMRHSTELSQLSEGLNWQHKWHTTTLEESHKQQLADIETSLQQRHDDALHSLQIKHRKVVIQHAFSNPQDFLILSFSASMFSCIALLYKSELEWPVFFRIKIQLYVHVSLHVLLHIVYRCRFLAMRCVGWPILN